MILVKDRIKENAAPTSVPPSARPTSDTPLRSFLPSAPFPLERMGNTPAPVPLPTATADSTPTECCLPSSFRPYVHLKGALDFTLALFLLILTAPLVLLALVLVKLTSRGPAFFSQVRLGRDGHPFILYKIRTMTHDAEKDGARWCLPGDSRVTFVGRWLRASHLDELPQLWNVLRGQMSLVGPRPERPEFVPHLIQAIPEYAQRLEVRPGLTGLAQVQLPADTDLASVRVKLAYDLYYVRHTGFWLDLRIGWATLLKMAGLPFSVVRWLFFLPPRPVVEAAYQSLSPSTV